MSNLNHTAKNKDLIASALPVIETVLNGVSKHIGHTVRWEVAKGATTQMPPETHPRILTCLAEAYQRTHYTGISLNYAKKQIEVAYQDSSGNDIPINRFLLRATQLGATVTSEQRRILAAAAIGAPAQQPHKKSTPEEKTLKYCEDSANNSDRAEDFMRQKGLDGVPRLVTFDRFKKSAVEPDESAYLLKKGVGLIAGDAFVLPEGTVVVPLRNAWNPTLADKPTGWQEIHPDGTKMFQKGQPITGQFYSVGDLVDSDTVLVCEGFATGQALHEVSNGFENFPQNIQKDRRKVSS
ncbi:MAG: hypothetical protein ABL925_18730 [Methylococcales bacterium]